MITSGENSPKEETRVNAMSLVHYETLTQRGYYVLGSNSFSPSLIPKTSRGRVSYCIRPPRVPPRNFQPCLQVL